MNFITTFTKEIYEICGKDLLQSFVNTGNDKEHKLYVFFENEDDLYTEYYPDWLLKWKDNYKDKCNETLLTFFKNRKDDV